MNSSEIRVLKERFARAVSFSILLAVLTNIVSMFFVMGSEACAESITLGSIQPFYDFEEESSEKLCQSRFHKETCSQQVNEKAPENTDPLTSLINAFEYIIRSIAGYFEKTIKH
ncbi:MAG: hypothetical protein QXW09_05070 [Thermoproteota archaeon]